MGTRYNKRDIVEYKGNKTYIVIDIYEPESDSPTYILGDSANGTREAKARDLTKKERGGRKFSDSKFKIGDLVRTKGEEGFRDGDGDGVVKDVHDTHGWADYEYEVKFNTGLPESPDTTDIIPEMDLEHANRE